MTSTDDRNGEALIRSKQFVPNLIARPATPALKLQLTFTCFYEAVCGDFAFVSALSLRVLVLACAPFEFHGSVVVDLPRTSFFDRCFVRSCVYLEYRVTVFHDVNCYPFMFPGSFDLVILVDPSLF